ncbi:hypothetical protein PLESTB_001091500 [Pleodorina starrii]|uniref:Uncharacterized protein n=1 Tax=Pleodorina starrii TaxID=330485 RepID=A0A9W6BQ89_9CHLO|nr:hypothetical protein PLESTB_001091500 [Pleodorina starrii]
MTLCGVRDFNLNDVFKPEPARLKRNLCAIINFGKFRDEKVAMLNDLEAAVAERMAEEQALLAEQERMLTELKRLKEHRAARELEAAAIQAETAAIAAKNAQLNKVHVVLSDEIRAIKAQCNALTDQAAEAKLTLNSLDNEVEELRDQIVQSPDRMQKAISDLVTAAETQRTYYAALRSTFNDYERKIEMIAKFERDMQRCIKLLEDLELVVARKKEVSATTKDTKEAIAREERQYNELVSFHQTARRQLASLQEKLNRMEQQSQLKLEAAAALVDDQIKRREAAEAEHAATSARAAEQEAQIRVWRERAEEVRATLEARSKAIVDKYNTLRRAVMEYCRRLESAMSANPELDIDSRMMLKDSSMMGAGAGAEDEPGAHFDALGELMSTHGAGEGLLLDSTQARDTSATERGAALLSKGVQRLTLG